jgi:hypothetical protein
VSILYVIGGCIGDPYLNVLPPYPVFAKVNGVLL